MKRCLLFVCAMFLLAGCSIMRSSSYHYTQKQIDSGDLDFDSRLKVDEYVNAFPQATLAKPNQNEDINIQVDFFSKTVRTNQKNTIAQIAIRTRPANAAESKQKFAIALVLDVSGSMLEGGKADSAIEAAKAMVSELSAGTEFSLITFESEAALVIKPTVVTAENRKQLQDVIANVRFGGGTNIEAGLVLGYQHATQFSKDKNAQVLLLTDGISNVGIKDVKGLAAASKSPHSEKIRISTIGLGHDVDEKLLREIAKLNSGEYYFADKAETLKKVFISEIQSLMIPAVKNLKLQITTSSGTIIRNVYGTDATVEGQTVHAKIDTMNVDSWALYLLELEGPMNALNVEATVEARNANTNKAVRKSSKKRVNVTSAEPQIEKIVARNSIVFSNALTLIEVSKLVKQQRYQEAQNLLGVQKANLEVARYLDDSKEWNTEFERLEKVSQIIYNKYGVKSESWEQPKDKTQLKAVIKGALELAGKTIPGPWSVILNLISIGF